MSALMAVAQLLAVLTGTADTHALVADPDGTVWAGTSGGLVRSNEGATRVFTPRDGLPDGTVRSLLRKGPLLFVGTDRGVARCRTTGDGLTVEATVGRRLRVEALAVHDGRLYLGTTTGLYVEADGRAEGRGEGSLDRLVPYRVTGMASAPDGLYFASPGQGTHRLGEPRRLRGDRLAWDVAIQGDSVWVATSAGLERYRTGRRVRGRVERASRAIPGRDLRSVRVRDGQLVVGSLGGGAWRIEGTRFVPDPSIPTEVPVQTLAFGPQGWLAGTAEGVAGCGAPAPRGPSMDNDLSALARTGEGLWIGTFDHGLVLLRPDGTFARFQEQSGLLDDRVNRLAVDGEGRLWVATDRGVVQRRGDGFILRGLLDRHVFALAFADGAIHAGAGDEVLRFDPGGATTLHPRGARPQDFATGPRGLVVASAEGLASADAGGWDLLTSDDGLVDDWVTAVAVRGSAMMLGSYASGVARVSDGRIEVLREDLWVNAGALVQLTDGTVAVGTLDDGLWLLRDGEWSHLGTVDGLPDDDVTALLPDADGTLWVATRGGLAHLALGP